MPMGFGSLSQPYLLSSLAASFSMGRMTAPSRRWRPEDQTTGPARKSPYAGSGSVAAPPGKGDPMGFLDKLKGTAKQAANPVGAKKDQSKIMKISKEGVEGRATVVSMKKV